jgi:hypothetical protein
MCKPGLIFYRDKWVTYVLQVRTIVWRTQSKAVTLTYDVVIGAHRRTPSLRRNAMPRRRKPCSLLLCFASSTSLARYSACERQLPRIQLQHRDAFLCFIYRFGLQELSILPSYHASVLRRVRVLRRPKCGYNTRSSANNCPDLWTCNPFLALSHV